MMAVEQRTASAAGAVHDALRLAKVAADQHSRSISRARHLLTLAAELPELHADPATCSERLATLLSEGSDYANYALVDLRGEIRCSAVPPPRPINVAGQRWFQEALRTGDFAVGEYTIGPVTGHPIIAVGTPVRDDGGRIVGVLSASIDLTWFNTIPDTTELPAGATVTVLDSTGAVLMRTPPVAVPQTDAVQPLIDTVLARRSGTAELPGLDGVVRLYGFTDLAPNGEGALLIIGLPADVAYAAANRTLVRMLSLFALVVLLVVIGSHLAGERLILNHVRPVVAAARRLGAGDLTARTAVRYGRSELSELAAAFDHMAATLQEREAELRRSAEERLAFERRLQHTQRLESLGVLAGGVAHDFNNLLAIIRGNVGLALMDVAPGDPQREVLEPIDHAVRRAADLTRQMLAYAGQGRYAVEPVSIGELICDAKELLRSSVPDHVALDYHFDPELPPVIADAGQIRQLVVNLVLNAGEAMEERPGRITITAVAEGERPALHGECVLAPEEPHTRYVALTVADEGSGIEPELVGRIFEPFYTTRFIGRGLGLSAAMGIVRGHGGSLCIDTAPSVGTTVQVLLPALVPTASDAPTEREVLEVS
jgi:signal transduction histidine kinase